MYLVDKFKGKYRIVADYDLDTEDFIRDEKGNLDPSFEDVFMYGRGGKVRIGHGCGTELSFYCPSTGITNGIVRKMYQKVVGNEEIDVVKCVKRLVKDGYMNEWTDCDEGFFTFDIKVFDDWVEFFGLKTSAASRSPFSTKNLPKVEYDIPDADMKMYKKACDGLGMVQINEKNREFMREYWGEESGRLRRESKLGVKEFIHKEGLWKEYCNFLR